MNTISLKSWLLAIRPHSLSATISPFLVVAALAFRDGFGWFHLLLWLGMVVAVLLVQVGANLTDEFSDHAKSADKYYAPHKVIARGLLSESQVRCGALVVYGIATGLGLLILSQAGWGVLPLCLGGVAVAWFYSAGSRPWGDVALGEILVFLTMGLGIVVGGVRVLTRAWSLEATWHALPIGALVSAILLFNNLRDQTEDQQQGKHTLVTQLGSQKARILLAVLFLLALSWPLLTLAYPAKHDTGWSWLVWASAPLLWRAWQTTSETTRDCLHIGLRRTATAHLFYGALLALALVLDATIPLADIF